MTTAIAFDIETGPRPWSEIECFFDPPKHPGEFDPAAVKYGNAKADDKRAAILAEAQRKHNEVVAGHEAKCEEAKAEFLAKAALSAITGRVVAIGVRSCKGIQILDASQDEAAALGSWWDCVEKWKATGRQMVGHNIFGFDLPFLWRRSKILGVATPGWLIDGRYWHRIFSDTMQTWACGQYGQYVGLNDLSLACGGDGKSPEEECSGATFATHWLSGYANRRAVAEAYLKCDLNETWKVAERLGLL